MPFHGRSTSATTAISGKLALRLIAVLGCTALASAWELVLVSNENNDDFKYYSDVWADGTPFNTDDATDTKNALFPAYTSIFVEKVRFEMDGTTLGTCGSACTYTFTLPEAYRGKYTLQELVTMNGGLELIDEERGSWARKNDNFFQFAPTEVSDGYRNQYYCSAMGLNYQAFPENVHSYSLDHDLGYLPFNVIVRVTAHVDGNTYTFPGMGSVAVDGFEVEPKEPYGGVLFAYNEHKIRLWAPCVKDIGFLAHVGSGWAANLQLSSETAQVRVQVRSGSSPDYDSNWVLMQSGSSDRSMLQRDFRHGLGDLTGDVVKVLYRAVDGANEGFVFEGQGAAMADNTGGGYGGVLFAYDDMIVRVMLPNGADGRAIFVPAGFGAKQHSQNSHDVQVRVMVWKTKGSASLSYATGWEAIAVNDNAFKQFGWNMPEAPPRIKVVVRPKSDVGWRFEGVGAAQGSDVRPRQYAGVISCYSTTMIRVWAPAKSDNSHAQADPKLVATTHGWGDGTFEIEDTNGEVMVVVWHRDPVDMRDTRTIRVDVVDIDEPPVVTGTSVTVPELAAVCSRVATVGGADPEGKLPSDFDFELADGNIDDAFNITGSGEVILAKPLDYFAHNLYTLTVEVSDGRRTERALVRVQVTTTDCAAGTYASVNGTECIPCAAGKYSNENRAVDEWTCLPCPAGKYAEEEGGDSESVCTPCSSGKYANATGATTCIQCDAGTYADEEGMDECTACGAGRFSNATGAASASTCEECEAGRYADATGMDECTACAAGTYSNATGAASASTCKQCDAGKYADRTGMTECAACVVGTFSTQTGAKSESTCEQCGTGKYADREGMAECTPCGVGRFSADHGARSESLCHECDPGTYADKEDMAQCTLCAAGKYSEDLRADNENTCIPCPPGTSSSKSGASSSADCEPCEAGTYAEAEGMTQCTLCPAGLASPEGSNSASNCQNPLSSFAVGFVFLLIAVLLIFVYICMGRSARVAFRQQQTSLSALVDVCTSASATILSRLQRERQFGLFWKLVLILVLFIALFVSLMLWFVTNVFLLSTSFFSPPDWLDRFEVVVAEFTVMFPLAAFLVVLPPIMRWIQAIDFAVLMTGVQVTCFGAQAPVLLVTTALIVVATILVIDSQFHAMVALAFVPMTSLVQVEMISAPVSSLWARARNMVTFTILVAVSAGMMSCTRYIMQVFTTLVEYSGFLPYREFSEACNDDHIDEVLAALSTVVFYAAIIPAGLLMIRVLAPGLPDSITFPQPTKTRRLGRYPRVKLLLDALNPMKWVMNATYWLTLRLIASSSAREQRSDLAASLKHQSQSGGADGIQNTSQEHRSSELPHFLQLVYMLWDAPSRQEFLRILWLVVQACCWKLKLALLVVLGVWTDEMAPQIELATHQFYGWTRSPMLLHEDVMSVVGPMRSMVWMLSPPLIILTKLAEMTNNPPVFVLTDKLHMTSPLLCASWQEAEAVMVEGMRLIEALQIANEGAAAEELTRWQADLLHNIRVALVWVLGARIPRYAVQISVLGLVLVMVIYPHVVVLLTGAVVLVLWSLILAMATVLDVRLMLRLRKEQPRAAATAKEIQMTVLHNPVHAAEAAEPIQ